MSDVEMQAGQQNAPILECHNLVKTFAEASLNVEVLRGIDLSVKQGERVAIMGASGSGKSTLLHVMGGLDSVTSGEVIINGENLSSLDEASKGRLRNQTLGFVYQFHHLLPEFTALENVAMPLLIRGDSVVSAKQKALDMLNKVGLSQRMEHKPAELSGGERQRTAIARALITRPLCLFADEPTGNLDHKTADAVYDLMLELNDELGTSIIMVTHDVNLANKLQRVLMLEDGVLKQ